MPRTIIHPTTDPAVLRAIDRAASQGAPTVCSQDDDPTTYDDCHLYPDAHTAADHATPPDCEHEPTDDGTACRFCGILAEPGTISPDALALLAQAQDDRAQATARILGMIAGRRAHADRRAAIEYAGLTDDELATRAALAGIVADRDALPLNTARPASWRAVDAGRVAGDTRQPGNDLGAYARLAEAIERQREAGDVWAAILRSRADYSASLHAAHHDAYTERELLAGWTAADGRTWTELPPLYRAGLDSDGPYPNPARVTPTGPGHVTGLQPPRSGGAHV